MILNNMRIHGYTFEEGASTSLGQSAVPAFLLIGFCVFDLSLSPGGSVLKF